MFSSIHPTDHGLIQLFFLVVKNIFLAFKELVPLKESLKDLVDEDFWVHVVVEIWYL